MSDIVCMWDTGTVGLGSRPCGRDPKAQLGDGRLVCGVHIRSARALNQQVHDLPAPDVRPGQVWADCDPRSTGRHVRVEAVDGSHATVVQCDPHGRVHDDRKPARRTRIRVDRFRPTRTGYRLVNVP